MSCSQPSQPATRPNTQQQKAEPSQADTTITGDNHHLQWSRHWNTPEVIWVHYDNRPTVSEYQAWLTENLSSQKQSDKNQLVLPSIHSPLLIKRCPILHLDMVPPPTLPHPLRWDFSATLTEIIFKHSRGGGQKYFRKDPPRPMLSII